MTLLQKFCARLGHPLRREIKTEIHLDGHFTRTRWYICRVCGEIVREEKQ